MWLLSSWLTPSKSNNPALQSGVVFHNPYLQKILGTLSRVNDQLKRMPMRSSTRLMSVRSSTG